MLKSTVSKIIERLGLAQSALKAPASALDDLLRARQAAEAAAAEATAEIERLAAARPRLLIEAGDEDLAKHDSDAAAAGRPRERAMAMIAPLDEKIAAAEREAEATRRRAIRAEAARKIAAAAAVVADGTPKLLELFATMHEAAENALAAARNAPGAADGDPVVPWPRWAEEFDKMTRSLRQHLFGLNEDEAKAARAAFFKEKARDIAPVMPNASAEMMQAARDRNRIEAEQARQDEAERQRARHEPAIYSGR